MKKVLLFATAAMMFAACNTNDCDCNPIKDKRSTPSNPVDIFEFLVEDCETEVEAWQHVTMDDYNNNQINDCWN